MKLRSLLALKATLILIGAGIGFSQTAHAAQIEYRTCKPVEVAVFKTRFHVRCEPIDGKAYTGDIKYYAAPIDARQPHLRYMLETLIAAKAHGRTLRIRFDFDDYDSVSGCKGSDCRRLVSVAMR